MIQKLTLKILNFFDYFHQKKIINFLKKNNIYEFDIFLDIGAHKGESIKLFSRNFIIKKIYSFEASPENFKILSYNIEKIKKNFNDREIIIENYAIGSLNKKMLLNQFIESSSSTLNRINEKSKYFKKKIKFLDNKNNEKLFNKVEVNQIKLKDYMLSRNIEIIDFMKIDTVVVDGAINGVGKLAMVCSQKMQKVQSGQIQHYAMIMLAGVIILIIIGVVLP